MIDNPILNKEILIRMRYGQQPLMQKVGVGISIVILLGFIYYQAIWALQHSNNPSDGYALWYATMLSQSIFILLITPVAATNAITKEREQRTWEMLVFTRLTPRDIILGKLIGRMFSTVLILLIGLPISLISWFHSLGSGGGAMPREQITPLHFFVVYLAQIIMGVFFTTFGLYMSLLVKRTLYAVMASFTFVIGGLLVATTFITTILSTLVGNSEFFIRCPLMWVNPGMIITELMSNEVFASSSNPTSYASDFGHGIYLLYGLSAYVLLTGLMIWRMIASFRKLAYER